MKKNKLSRPARFRKQIVRCEQQRSWRGVITPILLRVPFARAEIEKLKTERE